MRSLFLSMMCVLCLCGPALSDIERPDTIEDTLSLLLDRLKPTFPNARINEAEQNIALDWDGGQIVNPDNIHAVLQTTDDAGEREDALNSFVTVMTSAMLEPARDTATLPMDQIYPVLRHQSFAQATGDGGVTLSEDNALYFEPYLGDMILVYAIDYPDRVAYVTRADLRDAGVAGDAMKAAAWDNFGAKRAIARFEGNGISFMAIVDGFYESSMMLDDELWNSVSARWNDDIVMIVPARDLLIVAPFGETAEVAFLDQIRVDVLTTGTHQLSDLTYLWQDGRWQVFDD